MTDAEFKAHTARVRKIKALAERGATARERQAAEAPLVRIEPPWRMTAEELLAELEAV